MFTGWKKPVVKSETAEPGARESAGASLVVLALDNNPTLSGSHLKPAPRLPALSLHHCDTD